MSVASEEKQDMREKYSSFTYNELSTKAQEVAMGLIKSNPNTWKTKLKSNPTHVAIFELMREKVKGSKES